MKPMKRRKYILSLGATITGGAAVLRTGAFNNVEASREIAVTVEEDSNAFLMLNPMSEYATIQGNGTFTLDLSSDNPTEAGGKGVNANAETIIREAFEIKNQGTQKVNVGFRDEDGNLSTSITLNSMKGNFELNIGAVGLDTAPIPGESVSYNVTVFTTETTDPGDRIDETITVVAEAVNSE